MHNATVLLPCIYAINRRLWRIAWYQLIRNKAVCPSPLRLPPVAGPAARSVTWRACAPSAAFP
eukprot:scaffold27723_cov60-Phaeocystis_antarctica.AAC.4